MPQLKVTVKGGGALAFGKKDLKKVMRQAGNEVAATARALIKPKLTQKQVAAGKRRGASLPGEPPVSRTGLLRKSIKVTVYKSGEGVVVRDTAKYAKFLETGAKGGGGKLGSGKGRKHRKGAAAGPPSSQRVLQPRPFLSTALARKAGSIDARIKATVNQGVAWVREK